MLDKNEATASSIDEAGTRELTPLKQQDTQSRQGEANQGEDEKRLRKQNEVLVKLARECSLSCVDLGSGLRKITEAAAQTLNIERAGVWLYNDDHSRIYCVDLYERSLDRHSEGAELTAASYPSYFMALEDERTIAAHDARNDPRTREFLASYLSPLGITSMLDAPIRLDGQIVGVICHEHVGSARQWALDEQNFAGSMADLVSLVMEVCKRKRAEEELEKSVSLLRATLESTADSILVVDREGKIVSFNQKFVEMWRIPQAIIESRDANQARAFAKDQLKDPEGFIKRVMELYNQPDVGTYDVLEFKDERVFERYSQPQRIGGKIVGRVWSFRDITERRRAEEALRKNEALLQEAVRASRTGIFDHDHLLESHYWSPEQREIHGWRPEEPVSLSRFLDCVHPEDRERIAATARRAHDPSGDGRFDVEFRIIRRDGAIRWLTTRSQTFFSDVGGMRRPVRTIGASIDVTDHKRAEEALRESSQFNQQVIANAREGIIVYDRDLRYLVWNPFMEELSGLRAEKILGKHPRDLPSLLLEEHGKHVINEKTVEKMEAGLRRAMSGETFLYLDVPFVIKQSGMTGWSSVRYGPFRNAKGEIVGAIATIRDVTEQKRAEEEVRRSERKYRTLVENSPNVIMNIDREGTILFINHTLPQFTVEGVIGTNVTDYIPADQAVIYRKKIETLFNTGEPQSIMLDSVGQTRWQSQLIPIMQEGKIESALVIASDITERDRAAIELEKSVSLLSATLESTADGLFVVDRDGKIVSFNQKFVEIWSMPDSIIASRDAKQARTFAMDQLKDPEGFIKKIEELYSQPEATSYDILEFKDGRVFERFSQPQRIGGKSVGRVWSLRDITERKRTEEALKRNHVELEKRVEKRTGQLSKANAILQEQIAERKRAEAALQDALKRLQQLSHHILQIQENEYQFISRELHDNIAQSINAVKMGLERLDRDATPGISELRLEIRAAVTQLKNISQEVRKLSKQKRPEILDELGLTATLESYIKDFQKLTGIRMKFINKTSDKLIPANLAVHLYRIVQESLNNIAQHARATLAVVRLEEIGNELFLSIKDNGMGFSSDPSVKGGKGIQGIGLISIQERANLLNGTIEIISSPGNGTQIAVRVPRAE
jgi:PAS domain S-box-containing protein